jgi:hypothetical protein
LRVGTPTVRYSNSEGLQPGAPQESEALKNINDLVRMVASLLEHRERIPEEPADQVEITV